MSHHRLVGTGAFIGLGGAASALPTYLHLTDTQVCEQLLHDIIFLDVWMYKLLTYISKIAAIPSSGNLDVASKTPV